MWLNKVVHAGRAPIGGLHGNEPRRPVKGEARGFFALESTFTRDLGKTASTTVLRNDLLNLMLVSSRITMTLIEILVALVGWL